MKLLNRLRRVTKKRFFLILISLFVIFFIRSYLNENKREPVVKDLNEYRLKPKCNCRRELSGIKSHLQVKEILADKIQIKNKSQKYTDNYKFTCDMYSVLSRGANQRVFGFSIYGPNRNYFKHLRHNIDAMKRLHPEWIARVYYDHKFDKSVVCEFECNEDKVDFCNVSEMPYYNYTSDKVELYNASYVHAMMWRWFPIADDFVDYFSSRDIDSLLVQREKDSMNVWLNDENTLFHVMRDNPFHNVAMLGGMWGYANVRNRDMGKFVFKNIIDSETQKLYNRVLNRKNDDQNFLFNHIWPIARENCTQHDSYHCAHFNAQPFPTKRPSDSYCFVACFDPCCDPSVNTTSKISECPIECRKHPEWIYC